jgi:outer membrane protein assembly factor BamB
MSRRFCLSCLVGLVVIPAALAGDWMQFRGPGGQGVSDDKGLPEKWSETENIVWKANLPGPGTSSPITVGDAIFVTCYSGYAEPGNNPGDPKNLMRHLVCLDRKTGAIRWTKDVKPELPESVYKPGGNDGQHGYASSTPASDGKNVFVFFGKSGVFCFDLTGKQVWSKSVGDKTTGWGSATSPVLYNDLVIVNASVESGALVALNKSDGSEAWRLPGMTSAWSSPMLVDVPGGKQELVLNLGKSGKIVGLDPGTGKKLWSCEGNSDSYVCASVVSHDGVVYAIAGRSSRSVAVKAGGTGDVKELWTCRNDSRVNSPVYHEGHLYWLNEQRGAAMCVDAATGKEVYSQRLSGVGNCYASAVYADGKIYYVTKDGTTLVIAAKPKYELIATNKLADTSRSNASPVVDNGRLLIRTEKHLYCVGKK